MNYNDSVNYLYGLQKHGIKFGLDNIRKILAAFGNPQDNFSSVHVAGTNGKGSTSAIISSILKAAGIRTGLFTSPHLVSFTERIRVNGEEISEDDVIGLTDEIRQTASGFDDFMPTFFEVVTAMGFLYFKRKNADYAVVETGMGGRLDATNTLEPRVSVITGISLDHKEFLGNTLSEIAGEKAGIIKPGIPVITAAQAPEAIRIIRKKAEEKCSLVYEYGRDFLSEIKTEGSDGSVFDYRGNIGLNGLRIHLAGRHQVTNASLALRAIEALIESRSPLSEKITADAMRAGVENARWEGRLELISDNPPILIDGAHNPAAAAALADSLRQNYLGKYGKIILILGIMSDKDINGIMIPLLPIASELILTAPSYERSASPQRLAGTAAAMGFRDIHTAQTVREAIEMAVKKTGAGGWGEALILITGSFYTIGEAKETLVGKGILTRLRETR